MAVATARHAARRADRVTALSARAKARLRIAARLLGRRRLWQDECEEHFYAMVLQAIESLGAVQREGLRAQVDWVEDYERIEQGIAPRR
jgi:hypothetical protein